MNIGIDIDDTIADTFNIQFALAQKYTIEKLNKSAEINRNKLTSYQYYCQLYHDWTDEENKNFWCENYEQILNNTKPKIFVQEILKKIREMGHNIIIITARFPLNDINAEQLTLKWLNENDIIYDKLVVNAKAKSQIAMENNINIFIDDDLDNCIEVSNKNIKSFLMDSYHNQNIINGSIERVYSWPHVYQKILNY